MVHVNGSCEEIEWFTDGTLSFGMKLIHVKDSCCNTPVLALGLHRLAWRCRDSSKGVYKWF